MSDELAPEALIRQIRSAFDQERQLTACELHDRVVGDMQAALLHVETLITADALSESNYLDRIAVLLRSAIAESRSLLDRLATPMDQVAEPCDSNLVAQLQTLVDDAPPGTPPQVEFHHDTDGEDLSDFARRMLIGIANEAVNNARKYSRSGRIRIRLRRKGSAIQLDIRDWGVGFAVTQVGTECFGLRSIQARAALIGGRASISSAPHQGTEITVCVPT